MKKLIAVTTIACVLAFTGTAFASLFCVCIGSGSAGNSCNAPGASFLQTVTINYANASSYVSLSCVTQLKRSNATCYDSSSGWACKNSGNNAQ